MVYSEIEREGVDWINVACYSKWQAVANTLMSFRIRYIGGECGDGDFRTI